MFWVYGQYKYVHSFSGRTVFRRQNVTYKDDPRAARVKRERGGGGPNLINVIIMGSILKLGKRGWANLFDVIITGADPEVRIGGGRGGFKHFSFLHNKKILKAISVTDGSC